MELKIEQILYEKATETLAGLLASYEAGRISAETFKVGVETIWGCLGGVVRTADFEDLMGLANTEVSALAPQPAIRVFEKRDQLAVMLRLGETVRIISARVQGEKDWKREIDDEAICLCTSFAEKLDRDDFIEVTI